MQALYLVLQVLLTILLCDDGETVDSGRKLRFNGRFGAMSQGRNSKRETRLENSKGETELLVWIRATQRREIVEARNDWRQRKSKK
jgi:hypothetical protein